MNRRARWTSAILAVGAVVLLAALLRVEPLKTLLNRFGADRDGCTVYQRLDFESHKGNFRPRDQTWLDQSDDSCDGKALRLRRGGPGGEFGAFMPVNFEGTEGLKIAYLCKAQGVPRAMLNLWDKAAEDNITPKAYRWLAADQWSPVLYWVDDFRYNASDLDSRLKPKAWLTSLLFYGEQEGSTDTWMLVDNFAIYRGRDRTAPARVEQPQAEPVAEGVRLSWTPATDNVGVMLYVISRAEGPGGVFRKIGETPTPFWLDRVPAAGEYHYRVLACDFEENRGDWSDPVTVRCEAPPPLDPAVPTVGDEEREGYRDHVRTIAGRGAGAVDREVVLCLSDSSGSPTLYPFETEGALAIQRVRAVTYPGQPASATRARAPDDLERVNPGTVLILVGADSVGDEDTIAATVRDVTAIATAAAERGTVPVVGTVPPRGDGPEARAVAAYNQALIETCRKLQLPFAGVSEEHQGGPLDRSASARAWRRAVEQVRFVLRDRE